MLSPYVLYEIDFYVYCYKIPWIMFVYYYQVEWDVDVKVVFCFAKVWVDFVQKFVLNAQHTPV